MGAGFMQQVAHRDSGPSTLISGQTVLDRYYLLECLGRGASGVVFACKDAYIPRKRFAIKFLTQRVTSQAILAGRYEREVRALSQVDNLHITRFYDRVQGNGLLGFSMEYVKGTNLENLLKKRGQLSAGEVIIILHQLCQALNALHGAGLVHRDIKPANILLTDDGIVKLTDFGLVSLPQFGLEGRAHRPIQPEISPMNLKLTCDGDMVGTPFYASPEYIQAHRFDRRSDIYALGTVAFELLTGRLPYPASNVFELFDMKITRDAPKASSYLPECSEALCRIIAACLSRNPAERPSSCGKLLTELKPLVASAVQQVPLEDNIIVKSVQASVQTGVATRTVKAIQKRFGLCALSRATVRLSPFESSARLVTTLSPVGVSLVATVLLILGAALAHSASSYEATKPESQGAIATGQKSLRTFAPKVGSTYIIRSLRDVAKR